MGSARTPCPVNLGLGTLSLFFSLKAKKLTLCSSDNAVALTEIRLALSNISSNLGKLVPVESEHVVPPAIAA